MAFSPGEPIAYATGPPTAKVKESDALRVAPTGYEGFRRPEAARTASLRTICDLVEFVLKFLRLSSITAPSTLRISAYPQNGVEGACGSQNGR